MDDDDALSYEPPDPADLNPRYDRDGLGSG